MSTTIRSLAIDKLSIDEQLALVRATRDHIAPSGPVPQLSEAQREGLRRRVAADDAQSNDVIPWEQVKAEARKRTGQWTLPVFCGRT